MLETLNWQLEGCCNNQQIELCCLVGGYMVIIFMLWHTSALLPLKLLTVFLHEFGHASAAWMTCGKVDGIVVEKDQGGYTITRGGQMCCILPAGYLGSSFWGCFFVIMGSAHRDTSYVAAVVLGLALLGVLLFLAKNCLLRVLCVFFLAVVGGGFAADILLEVNVLKYILVLVGVMNGLFSVFDIYDDLLRRKVAESDASKFAELTGCSSRCWGFIWGILSLGFLSLAVYASLLLLDSPRDPP